MPANRPTPAELMQSIREYLEQDIKPLLARSVVSQPADDNAARAFALNNAIAVNLLKLLERESLLRAEQLDQERMLLRELFKGGDVSDDLDVLNAMLIDLIESDFFVDSEGNVLRVLQQISLAKLAIDNPAYSTLQKHRR